MLIARIAILVLLGVLVPAASLAADSTRVIVPSGRFGSLFLSSWFNRALWGTDYREIWSTPVELRYIDLDRFGGGLTVTGTPEVGGNRVLQFQASDGTRYNFHRLDQDPLELAPPRLQVSALTPILRDQISSSFPASRVVLSPLMDALGIPHARPTTGIIPDSETLGEHRAEFANIPGVLEISPDEPGEFEARGATRIVTTDVLDSLFTSDLSTRIDVPAYLTARLFDVWVGDWDRRRSHWRWADMSRELPGGWVPVPLDRDQAFARYDGFMLGLARGRYPELTKFSEDYPSLIGATWRGHEMDRKYLVALEWAVWDSVATSMKERLTDEVIEDAVGGLPPGHLEQVGEFLIQALTKRRDDLRGMAWDYYRLLAGEVDIHGTAVSDRFLATWGADGILEIHWWIREQAWTTEDSTGAPRGKRRFHPRETSEVRLYLGEGSNLVEIRGERTGDLRLRVIAGEGVDLVLDESSDHATRVYDSRPEGGVRAPGLEVDRKEYTPPPPEVHGVPPRDWGSRSSGSFLADFAGDVDLVLTGVRKWERLGFRTFPFKYQHRAMVSYSTGKTSPRLEYRFRRHWENSPRFVTFRALASGFEVSRFHGFGNDTPSGGDDSDFFKVDQNLLQVDGMIHLRPSFRDVILTGRNYILDFSGGVTMHYTRTNDSDDTFVGATDPYGSGKFGYVGVIGEFEYDSRNLPAWPESGHHVRVGGGYFPGWWDLTEGAFGDVHGVVSGYVPVIGSTVAWRLGGKKMWGTVPFQDAATIGGSRSVRGYFQDRFAGSGSLYGSADFRFPILHYDIILAGELGGLLLADAGRVWFQEESGGGWHGSLGAGLWVAPGTRDKTLSVSLGVSEERVAAYFHAGFAF